MRPRLFFAGATALSLCLAAPHRTSAQQPPPAKQTAGAHFERGVSLYSEGDFQGALAEFKRAYELSPNALVLYNIGQASFQVRDYASALKYFEQYLADGGANPPHKAEVEQNISVLKTRVGRLSVKADVPAEVSVDGEAKGKAPVVGMLLSVGKHKIVVRHEGSPPQERSIEIVAGDSAEQTFSFAVSPAASAPASAPPPATSVALVPAAPERSSALTIGAWVGAGLFTAGAVTTGLLALNAGNKLDDERALRGASRSKLDDYHASMRTFATATDILSAAAILTGGAALYLTLTSRPSGPQVGVAPGQLRFQWVY